jgi:hypothetical protein
MRISIKALLIPVQVTKAGYARLPYLTFEWLNNALKALRQPSVEVAISKGQVKTTNLTFNHPDISTRLIGARIADLPIDAPLADVLALLVKFRSEEIGDSGLSARSKSRSGLNGTDRYTDFSKCGGPICGLPKLETARGVLERRRPPGNTNLCWQARLPSGPKHESGCFHVELPMVASETKLKRFNRYLRRRPNRGSWPHSVHL